MEKDPNKKVIVLVSTQHREKVKKMSEILNKGLGTITEEAIDQYYDIIVYGPAEFEKFIKKNPRLGLYFDTLKKAFKYPCCQNMLKDIMLLDEKCEGKIFFTTFTFEGNIKKFNEYLNEKTKSAVLVTRSNPKAISEEVANKISDAIEKTEGDGEFSLHTIIDEDMPEDKIEIYLFAVYKEENNKK